jgi:tetratricopeptide (TPR) repeat protein
MKGFAVIAMVLSMAGNAAGQQIANWEPRWPSPQSALAGCDAKNVHEFMLVNAALLKNPRDEDALVNHAVWAQRVMRTSRYDMFWLWLAAKDLEQAIKLDPRDFAAWHNYGDVNYMAGDQWMRDNHSNATRAVDAFNHAVALNPKSARSYMGRGWAYYQMDDQAHASADFQKALQLDPSLRADMQKEIHNIDVRHGEEGAAKDTLRRMGSYYVEKTATTQEQCFKYVCYWANKECRCSLALDPGR